MVCKPAMCNFFGLGLLYVTILGGLSAIRGCQGTVGELQ